MRARLKGLRSDDISDLARWVPPEPDAFAVPLVLEVGPLGLRGKERFELLVVTPAWLEARHGRRSAVIGRGKLVVFEWSFERLKAFLAREVERCTGRTWPEVARKVGRIAEWEGEGEGDVVGLK
jgi:Immunity protein 8